jgi:hypothetical protein
MGATLSSMTGIETDAVASVTDAGVVLSAA